jgi:hypothetical protein
VSRSFRLFILPLFPAPLMSPLLHLPWWSAGGFALGYFAIVSGLLLWDLRERLDAALSRRLHGRRD